MDIIVSIFSFIQNLGVSVMMPIILTIIGCVLGAGFGKSLKAGLMVGVGFIGLNLVISNLLGTSLEPATTEMIERYGLSLSVIDIGWPASSAIAMASSVGLLIIPLGIVVNLVMLFTNTTQTVDVDIWNYWHFAFTGALVAIVTGNVAYGFIAAVVNMAIVLIIADVTAPQVEKSLGIPDVSLPTAITACFAPIAWVFNWIIDKIPVIRDIDINVESLQKRFGVFGEPVFIGTIIGIIIGFVAYFDASDIPGSITSILTLGVQLGAVLVLIPRMASLLMEGLIPISDAASDFIKKHFKNRGKLYIGLDSALGVGHPVTLSMALILIPVSLVLAIAMQGVGNRVLPFGDLSTITYMLVLVTPIVNNNGFRGVLIGAIVIGVGLLISTDLAPLVTQAAIDAEYDIASAAGSSVTQISSLCDGANPLTWIIVKPFQLLGNPIIAIVIVCVVTVALCVWNRLRIQKQAQAAQAGASDSE